MFLIYDILGARICNPQGNIQESGDVYMKTNLKQIRKLLLALLTIIIIVSGSIPAYAKEANNSNNYFSKYITVDGQKMHISLYGDIRQNDTEGSFANKNRTNLVMLPGMGVPSPHLYFKPLAQALDEDFNVVIIEPLGYGLSDLASTTRNVDNINTELNKALNILDINECVLLTHSISGVYGLNFVLDYPEHVKGFIAIDNTIYDDAMQDELAMEQEYMLNEVQKFDELRTSFPSIEDFQTALTQDPAKYGAALPEITGYTYPESDMDEYIKAYSLSSNESIRNEISQINNSLLTIKGKKFPDSLPVLTMISSINAENIPSWKTGHLNQLNLQSNNHELYTLEGTHYIWYTNLSGIVDHIYEWQNKHDF